MIEANLSRRGFLPDEDPLVEFPADSELAALDRLGRDLPSLLQEKTFRAWARGIRIPPLPAVRFRCRTSGSITSESDFSRPPM